MTLEGPQCTFIMHSVLLLLLLLTTTAVTDYYYYYYNALPNVTKAALASNLHTCLLQHGISSRAHGEWGCEQAGCCQVSRVKRVVARTRFAPWSGVEKGKV